MADTIGSTSNDATSASTSNGGGGGCPVNITERSSSSSIPGGGGGKCPVDHKTRSLWNLFGDSDGDGTTTTTITRISSNKPKQNQVPASLEEAARYAQTPRPGQRIHLSTHRLDSTIPRSSTNEQQQQQLPAHQIRLNDNNGDNRISSNDSKNNNRWIYPSEQQVFNAMKRKGWDHIEEESIPSFLQIHNSVNERSWKEVLKWEKGGSRHMYRHAENDDDSVVELSRFEGRPQDITPKAWFLSTFGIRNKPFDRHDWYVVHKQQQQPPPKYNNNENGDVDGSTTIPPTPSLPEQPEKRYVLDFYMTDDDDVARSMGMMPRVDIDVRPALDTPDAFFQRGKKVLREIFPGISRELDEWMYSSSSERRREH